MEPTKFPKSDFAHVDHNDMQLVDKKTEAWWHGDSWIELMVYERTS